MSATTTAKEKLHTVTETNPAVDEAVRDKIITARVALLLKAPFFGNLATRLQLINADEWCPTAATDGRRFYYNSEFVNNLPQKQIEFLIAHEILHVVYDHMGRRDQRDPRLFNCAADFCVNGDLIQQKIGEFIPVGLHDKKYYGWSAEEVYDDLYENADKLDIDELLEHLVDEHLDGEGDGENGDKDSSGRPQLSAEERKAIRDEMRDAVLQAAESAGTGNVPAGVKRMISHLTNPQLNWRELIQQQIQSLVKSDFTWQRPSRRSWHIDAVLPGSNFADTIEVVIAVDTSGSMSESMLRDILSEVKGIMQSFDDFKLTVWSFDTKVYNQFDFTPDNIDEIDSYELLGGGGTDFDANWIYMKENDISPKLFVMFTDMYPYNSWGDPDYCDTLFVNHSGRDIIAPFGITADYDFPDKKK